MKKILFDTTILIASFVATHPQHKKCQSWFDKAKSKKLEGSIAAHSLAECYAVLTRLPLSPKITPNFAIRLIEENLIDFFNIVYLNAKEHWSAIKNLSKSDLSGGITYDAIILSSAKKEKADHLLTLNAKHFKLLEISNKNLIISP